jgi:hypothetical protein
MLGLSAVVVALTVLLSTVLLVAEFQQLSGLDSGSSNAEAKTAFVTGFLTAGLPAVLLWLATTVLSGLLIVAVSEAVLGRRPTPGEVWQRGRRRVPALIGLALLTLLATSLGLLLPAGVGALLFLVSVPAGIGGMAVLGFLGGVPLMIFLAVRLAFSAPALLLEQLSVRAAMRRSWRLGTGSFWRVLGIILLTGLIAAVVNGLLGFPFSMIGALAGAALGSDGGPDGPLLAVAVTQGVAGIGTILSSTVTAPFSAAVTALLYIDLRMRREGLDVTLAEAAARPTDTA